jgi:hypothetical protein
MQTTRQLRCDQCGHESDPHYRFCGMCGSRLPSLEALPAAKVKVRGENEVVTRPVSGPSFLGLAEETSEPVSYLLEDEPGGSNGARLFFVVLLFACLAAAGWHWRGTIRGLVVQATQQKKANPEPQATSYKTAPISTAGSEVAGAMPNAEAVTETPQTDGASQPATPQPGAAQPGAAQPTTDQLAASPVATQTSGNTPLQANASQPQSAQVSSGGTQAPSSAGNAANGVSAKQDEPSTQNTGPSQSTRASQSAAAKKSSNSRGDSASQDERKDAANQTLEATGEKYLYGNGAPPSCTLAQKNLLAAAESSNSRAASVLGTMYATGHCVTRDLPLAYFWFAKAMQQEPNNDRLERDLTAVWNEMTPDERQVAIHHR